MKEKTEKLNISKNHETSKAQKSADFGFYTEGLDFGVLDIETTGLSPWKSQFVLGGMLTEHAEQCVYRQFLAENIREERETLKAYLNALESLDVVTSYNGKSFDIPFIYQRAKYCRLNIAGKLPHNIDLYLILDKYTSLRKILPNLKQKTVETYFGLWSERKDEISGAESVDLYYRYSETGDRETEEKILLHNSDDLEQLYRLTPIIKKADIHRAMFDLGFPASKNLSVEKITMTGGGLKIAGVQRRNPVNYIAFPTIEQPNTMSFDGQSARFEIRIPITQYGPLSLVDIDGIVSAMGFGQGLDALKKYPAYDSGYLVLSESGNNNFREINHLAKLFLANSEKVIGYDCKK